MLHIYQGSHASAACKPQLNRHIITFKFSWMSKPITKQTTHHFGIFFCSKMGLNLMLMRGCRDVIPGTTPDVAGQD